MIEAQGTNYIIKQVDQPKTTAGGIHIQSTGETQLAEVCSVGSEVKNPLPVGSQIIVDWRHPVPIKYQMEQLFAIDEKYVLGALK
jgi:co-chaperonin GroES (HSP10)